MCQDDGTRPWTPEERTALKDQVVPVMMALAGEPALQVQIGESISLMAETDFPQEWDNLIDVRCFLLNNSHFPSRLTP